MKTLYKDYDYTPQRWRKAGKMLDEAGTHHDTKKEALADFSDRVKALVNRDTFNATLDTCDCESLEITHPDSMESRVLSIQFDEYHGYCVSLSHN